MRALLILVAIVVLAGIVGVATGFINLSGKSGEMPRVAVEGGKMPSVSAETGSVDVGTAKTTVDVPKVETEKKTVEVPTLSVKKANEK